MIFFLPFLIQNLIAGILAIPILSHVAKISEIDFRGPPDVVWNQLRSFFLTFLLLLFLSTVISWIIGSLTMGISVKAASNVVEKDKTSLKESFNSTIPKLPSILLASFITGIATFAGFLALIVPGIILQILFYLVIPILIVEDIGVLESLSRSMKLVNSRWLKTFVLSLIVGLITGAVSVVATFATPLGIYRVLIGNVIAAFAYPLVPISTTIYYYSMRAKEEKQLRPPPPPPPF
jgi:hypothetical protein